ncbi:conserved hypothetical protein [Cyanobium sp. PCC 7001]|nr:conserved hypothetical protein [Cyanobium sp. PCC 7001]
MLAEPDVASPLLTCLVPARNAAQDLPGFLESVALFCDAVVALDDGSTDNTASLLASSSLVRILLANPRRETYHGWDDAANRARLLEAASALKPRWLLWLDADERLDPAEGQALRQFITAQAMADSAYGFRVFPLRNDLEHYEERCLWVYRLFHHAPGQILEGRRLHLFPIPAQIPRSRWRRTTLRIQHLGGLTAARRRSRYDKYRQADPACEFQTDYRALLRDPPAALPRWTPRSPHEPMLWEEVVATASSTGSAPGHAARGLSISFLVLLPGDAAELPCPGFEGDPLEILQPGDADGLDHELLLVDNAVSVLPEATPPQASPEGVGLESVALNGLAINTRLVEAKGEIVCFLAPWLHYSPGAFRRMVEAHRRGFAMVTGAHHHADQLSGDRSLPPSSGDSMGAVLGTPPDLCSWRRDALLEIGGFPPMLRLPCRDLNAALMAAGWQAYAAAGVQMDRSGPVTVSHPS